MAIVLGLFMAVAGGIGGVTAGEVMHRTWLLCVGIALLAFVSGIAFDYFVIFRTPKAERVRDARIRWTAPARPMVDGHVHDEALSARLRAGEPPVT